MKRFFSLLFGAAIACSAATTHADITTGLVGEWNFDDQTLDESSGFRADGTHDGVAVGTVGYLTDTPSNFGGHSLDLTAAGDSFVTILDSNEKIGGGIGFAGPNNPNYVNTFDAELANGFTIAFWGKGTPNTWAPYISKNGEGGAGYQVRRRSNDARVTPTLRSTGGDDDPAFANIDTLALSSNSIVNDWHHYTMTWTSGAASERNFYIDGVLVGTTDDSADGSFGLPRFEFLTFGGRDSNTGLTDAGAVQIDEVRIYNRALVVDDIALLQVASIPEPSSFALCLIGMTGLAARRRRTS